MVKVYKMNTKFRQLYLVITNNKIRFQDMQQKVHICYCKVSSKRYVNKKELIQCHRCQKWGHATSNCNMTPKCLKCAKNHLTDEGTKTPDTDATCANCGGKHPANIIECEVYQRRLRAKQARRRIQSYTSCVNLCWWEAFQLQRMYEDFYTSIQS